MAVSNGFIKLDFKRLTSDEQYAQLNQYVQTLEGRRSVRAFSDRPVSEQVLEKVIHAAGTAPSGANQQPWTYVLIKDPQVKKAIREAAELEEKQHLEKAGMDGNGVLGSKAYLEDAPYLVALFKINYGLELQPDGSTKRIKHYYVHESAPISAGFLLAALQHAGIDSLVHAPVAASHQILNRPKNESPLLLFAVGYAKEGYQASEIMRKPLSEIIIGESPFSADPYSAPPYAPSQVKEEQEQLNTAEAYYQQIKKRRNVRHFSTEDVDINLIYKAIEAAATTPSCGNLQPYRFAIISDMESKMKIRELAEIEERKLYEERISDEWREALAPLGTNHIKEHLTDAPYLIVAFKVDEDPQQAPNLDSSLYHPKHSFSLDSASMAVGILMGALHHAGLCTLTHTPSPMYFLRDYLNRPKNETPFVVLPVGYPIEGCEVPNIKKKQLSEILFKF